MEGKDECTTHYTDQDLRGRLGDGRQHIDTLGGEVSLLGGVDILAHAPSRVHDRLTVGLVQDNQVTLLEGEEG